MTTDGRKAKIELPPDFKHPEPPQEMVDALHDAIGELIKEYLPREWQEALGVYAMTSAYQDGDSGRSMADFKCWVDDLSKLQSFLAGLRYDETGHQSEWVGPAPKLGKAKGE